MGMVNVSDDCNAEEENRSPFEAQTSIYSYHNYVEFVYLNKYSNLCLFM